MDFSDEFGLNDLNDFLIRAKRNGYASGIPAGQDIYGVKHHVYREKLPSGRQVEYFDSYVTGNRQGFVGFEQVCLEIGDKSITSIWGMAYHGRIIIPVNKEREDKINSFLRQCLMQVPSGFPVRGPIGKPVTEGNLRYDNFSDESDIRKFSGVETITLIQEDRDKKIVHEVNYSGGIV